MAVTFNTNVSALTSQRYLAAAGQATANSLAKLSSGSRVPTAKDDAAALAIGTKLKAEVAGLQQASNNASQAISLLQIADGALATTSDILQRMKSLAVQASSGQLSTSDRSLLNQEFTNLRSEIERIAQVTNFNGSTLLNGGTVTATYSYAAPGQLPINGITAVANTAQTSDGDAFRVSYDYTNATQDIGNLTVTNLLTGESQTIDITSAIQAVTGEAAEDLTTDLTAGQTVNIEFTGVGLTLTLDHNFDVNGTGLSTTLTPLAAVYAGGTAASAASRTAVSGATVPTDQGAAAGLSVTGLAELVGLSSTVYDQATGNLYLNFVEDTTNNDYGFAATTGLEFSVDGGSNFYAGGNANVTNISEATASTVQVRLATSQEVILEFNIAAHTVAADQSSVLGFNIGTGIIGVTETVSATKSFSFKVGTGVSSNDSVSFTLNAADTSTLGISASTIDGADGTNANNAITALNAAINTVASRRADVGAAQSRLQFAADSVAVAIENTTGAQSALLDVDVSAEITTFTSQQVLLQAGVSLLAQANQQPALLLRLLQ